MFHKKILKYTPKNIKYVQSLPTIYLICRWAGYGILEEKVAFWEKDEYGHIIPYIYQFNDHNGEYDSYVLMPYYWATTGEVFAFVQSKHSAQMFVDALNQAERTDKNER